MNIIPLPCTITLSDDVWLGKTLVSVFPRRIDRPSRSFDDPAAAVAYAADLAKEIGGEIFDAREVPPEVA